MRVLIRHTKKETCPLVTLYLENVLLGQQVDAMINGARYKGIVEMIDLSDDLQNLVISIGNKHIPIPILEESRLHLFTELFVVESDTFTAVIEVI